MPICWPEEPRFASATERRIWELVRDQLRGHDLLVTKLRGRGRSKDYAADLWP